MLIYLSYAFTLLLSASLALYLTPLVREAAVKFGLMAHPDGDLRTQTEPVAYLGGIAIYLGFLLALSFTFDFTRPIMGLLLGGTVVLMVGLIDDFGVLTPWMKLFGQAVAVLALLKSGIVIQLESIPTWEVLGGIPVLHYALSAFWLLGIANAFNFLDTEDGLAAGVGFFCCLSLFGVAFINGRSDVAALTLALAGGILGFLRYNVSPARIYLGDAGSLFLGLMLGALAMIGSYTEVHDLALLCPLIILGVPCFEIGQTTLARMIKGIPVMQGSPDHIVKRLKRAGLSKQAAVYLHWAVSLLLGVFALILMQVSLISAAVMLGGLALITLVVLALLLRIKVQWQPQDKG